MPLTGRWTLTRYLIEERRRYPDARGELNALLLDVALACKAIARHAAFGALGEEASGSDTFLRMTEWNGQLAGLASTRADAPLQVPAGHARGKYLLVFDPLDGAAERDVNAALGSLFSVLRAPQAAVAAGRDATEADFLQPGSAQVAAGYAIYGPSTMLVLTVGNGVAGFTLDPSLGEFVLTHPDLKIPAGTRECAIDPSGSRDWEPPIRRYVDECAAGRAGVRGGDFRMRGVAGLVADAHRIMMRGGLLVHPRNARDPARPGLVRLLHQANPVGLLMEQAGGRASTGRQPVLGVAPGALAQRIGLVLGARDEVERIERYHADTQPARGPETPLFAERSLFRR